MLGVVAKDPRASRERIARALRISPNTVKERDWVRTQTKGQDPWMRKINIERYLEQLKKIPGQDFGNKKEPVQADSRILSKTGIEFAVKIPSWK